MSSVQHVHVTVNDYKINGEEHESLWFYNRRIYMVFYLSVRVNN